MRSDAKGSFAEKDGRSVLTVLHHERARPHGENLPGRARKILFPRQHLSLGVVDQENIHQLQRLRQLLGRALDPKIHGVAAGQTDAIHFQAHRRLQGGMDVGEEQKLRVRIFLWNAWLKFFEYIQFREIGFGLVQVVDILPAPTEGFPLGPLDAACVDAALFQHGFVFGREVVAHHRYHPHFSEVTCGQREISRSTSQNVVYSAGRRDDRVKGNGTYYQNAHESPYGGRWSWAVVSSRTWEASDAVR